jgi:hypothetical protein
VLNQTASVALPGAWYLVPFFWHMNGVALGAAIIACKKKSGNQLPAVQRTRQAERGFGLQHCVGGERKIELRIERY